MYELSIKIYFNNFSDKDDYYIFFVDLNFVLRFSLSIINLPMYNTKYLYTMGPVGFEPSIKWDQLFFT